MFYFSGVKTRLLIIFFLLLGICGISYGDERLFSREYSLKNSDLVVVALKIGGRIDCDFFREHLVGSFNEKCFGENFSDEVKSYNNKKLSEDFLILQSFKGPKSRGSIIEVSYKDIGGYSSLGLGQTYLMFIHFKNGSAYYEACDVAEYKKVKRLINSDYSYEEFVESLLLEAPFICPEIKLLQGNQGN